MNVTPSTSPGLLLCPDTMEEDCATPPTQHATLYLVHRRTLVHWLLDVAYVNPLSQVHPFLTVHRAVALFDHLIAIPQLPHLCAVSTARLPLMAVACLSIASREGALGALSPTLLNKICEERYSEAIIVKMDALLTQILRLTRQPFTTTTTQHNDHNHHEKEKEGDEEEREREVEGLRETLTSRDWVEIFHATSQEGEDIQRQMSLMVLEYANLFCDSFLAEESVYFHVWDTRTVAAAALATARKQVGLPAWSSSMDVLTWCSFVQVLPCIDVMEDILSVELKMDR